MRIHDFLFLFFRSGWKVCRMVAFDIELLFLSLSVPAIVLPCDRPPPSQCVSASDTVVIMETIVALSTGSCLIQEWSQAYSWVHFNDWQSVVRIDSA